MEDKRQLGCDICGDDNHEDKDCPEILACQQRPPIKPHEWMMQRCTRQGPSAPSPSHEWKTPLTWTDNLDTPDVRTFASGATRDTDEGKPEYGGFFSPLVIEAYGAYMTKHRVQANGELRASDNWQKGMDKSVYFESAFRHFVDLWKEHCGYASRDGIDEALGGLLFNIMGYWLEYLREREVD